MNSTVIHVEVWRSRFRKQAVREPFELEQVIYGPGADISGQVRPQAALFIELL